MVNPFECTSMLERCSEFSHVLVYMSSQREQVIELFEIKVKFNPIILA